MVRNRKVSGRAVSLPAGIGIGTAGALGWTLIGAGLLAKLIEVERLPESAVGYGAMVILLSASFLGAVLAFGKVKARRLQVCLLTSGAYYLCLLAATAMFFGGQYTGMGVTSLVVFGGGGAAVLLGKEIGNPRKGRRKYPKLRT